MTTIGFLISRCRGAVFLGFRERVRIGLVAMLTLALFLSGCGSSMPREDKQQVAKWRADGVLAAGPWGETFPNSASVWNMAWVRQSPQTGLVKLYTAGGARCDAVSSTALSHLPADCYALNRANMTGDLIQTTASGKVYINGVAEVRILASGRVLLYGDAYYKNGNNHAVLLGRDGKIEATWDPPERTSGLVAFMGPLLVGYHVDGPAPSKVVLLEPETLKPLVSEVPLAVAIDRNNNKGEYFKQIILRDPTPGRAAAKVILMPTGPLELPFTVDRLLPYRIDGESIVEMDPANVGWKVSGWLAERDGAIIAVFDKEFRLRAAGITAAELVVVKGFIHAAGTPGFAAGVVVCDTEGHWQVVWQDDVESAPPGETKEQALFNARGQRGDINVESINAHNKGVILAHEIQLAREAAKRAEEARAQALKAEYAMALQTFVNHIAQKNLRPALSSITKVDKYVMNQTQGLAWEQACADCINLALQSTNSLDWIATQNVFFGIEYRSNAVYSEPLRKLNTKIYALTPVPAQTSPSNSSSGSYTGQSFARELPGDTMRAAQNRLRQELQAVGANWYEH